MAIISSEASASTSLVLTSTSSQASNNSNNEDTSSPNAAAAETTTQASMLPISSQSSPLSMSFMENKFSEEFAQLTASFLEDADLSRFLKTARFSHAACQSDMAERKRVKEELLPHVFGGNPDAVDTFFETHGATFETLKLLLTKTRFREGYQSEKFKQFICFREWRSVSPLQAAALCGDEFLLINLLTRLPQENECRLEAIQQLEEVRSRISAQKIILDAAIAVAETYAGDETTKNAASLRLEEIQQSKDFQLQMAAFRKEMELLRNQMTNLSEASKAQQQQNDASAGPTAATVISSGPMTSISMPSNCSSSADRKTQAETKKSVENSQITYADNAEFLAPVTNLLKACIDFLIQKKALSNSKWGELDKLWVDKLWEIVGECHKRLPHYFKQEFFDNKPFIPPPSFETSPSRGPCLHNSDNSVDNSEARLDLDGLGFGSGSCFSHGASKGCCAIWGTARATAAVRAQIVDMWPIAAVPFSYLLASDLEAVARLYELRLNGLENIIKQLKKPETSQNLEPIHHTNRSPDAGAGPGPGL